MEKKLISFVLFRQCLFLLGRLSKSYSLISAVIRDSMSCEQLIDDSDIASKRVRATAGINALEGIGVSEAPGGTLFHHYQVDKNGLIQKNIF